MKILLFIMLGPIVETMGPFSNMEECELFKKQAEATAKQYFPKEKFDIFCKEIKK